MRKEWRPIRTFDYKVVMVPLSISARELEMRLDALGAEGWELVGISGETYVFKRLVV